MVGSILVAFDAYQPRENGKHTARAMQENACQGFWNGSRPPFGYRTVEAGRRGDKAKKVLAVHEEEAETVRRIFAMYLGTEGRQFGVNAIAAQLNEEQLRFRGKRFAISNVHRILTRETYAGVHWFNVIEAKTGRKRPQAEQIAMASPVVIERGLFDRVQAQLAERNPKQTPPRTVSGPTLLGGVAVCAGCGSGMTLRTGKSNAYRYYACAGRAQQRAAKCDGCALPMDCLDGIVLDQLADRVFRPDRLQELLSGYLDQTADAEKQRKARLGRLKAELTETEGAIQTLLGMVERGLMDLDDLALAERLSARKLDRLRLAAEIGRAAGSQGAGPAAITPEKLERLAEMMRQKLKDGPAELRRAYLRMFIHYVVVSRQEILISGPSMALARAAALDAPKPSGEVLSFVRGWRPASGSPMPARCFVPTPSASWPTSTSREPPWKTSRASSAAPCA